MGLYDDQIKTRQKNDQKAFEDSMKDLANRVLGTNTGASGVDESSAYIEAIDEVLWYFGEKESSIPDEITDPQEQLEAVLRPAGIAWRDVRLEGKWVKHALGPLITRKKENGLPVALLPTSFGGYREKMAGSPERRVTKASAVNYDEDAIMFYRPLPSRALKLRDIFNFLRKSINVGDVIAVIALTLAVTLTGMFIPVITEFVSGFVLQSEILTLLAGTAVLLICAGISSKMFELAKNLAVRRLTDKTAPGLQAALMNRVLCLPVPFFKKYSSGEMTERVEAVNEFSELVIRVLFSTGLSLLMSLLYLGEIFFLAPSLEGPAVVIVLVTLGVMLATSILRSKVAKRQMEAGAHETGLAYALLTGVQKIRLAGAEKRVFAKWAGHYSTMAYYAYNPPMFLKLSSAIRMLVSMAGTIILYAFAVKGKVAPFQFIAFSSAYGMITAALGSLTDISDSIARIRPLLSMTEPLLSAVPETAGERQSVHALNGAIELSNVSFRYNDRMPYVVENMNIRIQPGEYVAIVGKTGCGKSTLLRLLLGFESPERGSIYYDGMDMSKLDLRTLRRRIGTVTQDGALFSGSIFENISIISPNMSEADAWKAAEISGIADDIAAMPMGMHTIISEGQGGISGGQKQRLMIARAVAPKPDILMFDEATSALDNRTQKKIANALDGLKCTRIVIAHRLSTIEHCDRILLLDKGRIVEEGNYQELMERKGAFYELVERQRVN